MRVIPPGRSTSATFFRLRAPSASATSGVTFAGRRFGAATATGMLVGTPKVTSRRPFRGAYTLTVYPASVVLLTVTPR